MDFKEFLGMYEAYKQYRDVERGNATGAPAPNNQGVTPTVTTPPQAAGGEAAPNPNTMIAQMEQRLAQMEARMRNPSMATAEPKGLEDIFNRMLGDAE